MTADFVTIGGAALGDFVRLVNGITALLCAGAMIRAATHAGPPSERRSSLVALGGVWGFMGLVLVIGGLGFIPSTWVPWMVHGCLIMSSLLLASAVCSGVRHWKQMQEAIAPLSRTVDSWKERDAA